MTSTPELSLIITVYNKAQHIAEALESVQGQTIFQELEIVIVDDGSTDGSQSILESFQRSHQNVHLIRQENAGAGAARNVGLQAARGEYVTYMDADDVLPERALERLRDVIVRDGTDIAIGNLETFPVSVVRPYYYYFGKGDRVVAGIEDMPELIHASGPCNKLFRRSYLVRHGWRFEPGVHFEDAFLVVPALLFADGISLVDEVVYRYRREAGSGSIMDSLFTREANYWDHLLVEERLASLRGQLPARRQLVLDRFLVRSFQGFALRAPEMLSAEDLPTFFSRACKAFENVDPSIIGSHTANARHRIPLIALVSDNYDAFSDPLNAARRLVAHDGDLFVDLGALDRRLRPLTKAKMRPFGEALRLVDGGRALEVSGRLTVDAVSQQAPLDVKLSLRLRGSGLTVPAQLEYRSDLARANPLHAWAGFRATLPLPELRDGIHELRLVLETPTGQASAYLRQSHGWMRSARVYAGSGRKLLPRTSDRGACRLQVRQVSSRLRRAEWKLRRGLEDVKHIARGRPLKWAVAARLISGPLMARRDIVVLGERRDTAQDNSVHLFAHMRRGVNGRNVYYVLERGSDRWSSISKLGNVVAHGSLYHRWLMLHARVLANSYDVDSYMLPRQWSKEEYLRHLAWRVGSRRVFLQHGVTHNDVSRGCHWNSFAYDLFVCASPREARFVRDRMGYVEEPRVTGFPRFDSLNGGPGKRRIVFMPTWRLYLSRPSYAPTREPIVQYEGSSYATFMQGLLGSPMLHALLEKHDFTFHFFPHYEMGEYLARVQDVHPRIVVRSTVGADFQEAIREAGIFMTDWSSTSFDAALAGKPVIYCTFDEDEFFELHARRGYWNARRDGFGPVADSVAETIERLEEYMARDCKREPEYEQRVDRFFAFRDRRNSERVERAIMELLARSRAGR